MLSMYADWYFDTIVKDIKGVGVMYAPQLKAFTCVQSATQAAELQQYTSLPELTAMFQVSSQYSTVPRWRLWLSAYAYAASL